MGCSAAYYLTKQGASVALFEQDSVAGHASGFAFGGVIKVVGGGTGDAYDRLALYSERLHFDLGGNIERESGIDTGFRKMPHVSLATSEAEAKFYRAEYRRRTGNCPVDVRWLSYGELSHIEARISPEIFGGLYIGEAYDVQPASYTTAIWRAAERMGGTLHGRKVESLVRTGQRVTGVVAGGDSFGACSVIIAAGPWSGSVSGGALTGLPVTPLKGQIIRMRAPGPPIKISLSWNSDYATTKQDGLVWAGTTEERAGFDDAPTPEGRAAVMASAVGVLPYLEGSEVVRHTACLRPITPDGLPVIGPVPGAEGAFISTGAGRNGIQLGPAMGKVVAEMALGREPRLDLEFADPARFAGV